MKKLASLVAALFCAATAIAQTPVNHSLYVDSLQKNFVDLRFGQFIHFNMPTWTGAWGGSRANPLTFNPTKLNCGQWVQTAKAAGMRYSLLTVKHHDGFCLWPSKATPPNGLGPYTVAQSSIPTRDVVKEFVDACRAEGILPCFYFSVWDDGNGVFPTAGGSTWEKERKFLTDQITELLGGTYGDIYMFGTDAWEWRTGHRRVPYAEIRKLIKTLQPKCIIQNCAGIGSLWEADIIMYESGQGGTNQAQPGDTTAANMCHVISGSWFWTAAATDTNQLKSVSNIVSLLNNAQPLFSNITLNTPPNRDGLIDQAIVTRCTQVGKAWTPIIRRPLPPQMPNIHFPVLPASATVSSNGTNTTSGKTSLAAYAYDGVLSMGNNGIEHNESYCWKSANGFPQNVTADMGNVYYNIDMFGVFPHRNPLDRTGAVADWELWAGTDTANLTKVAEGTWISAYHCKTIQFNSIPLRYMRFVIKSAWNSTGTAKSGAYVWFNEIDMGGRFTEPSLTPPVGIRTKVSPAQTTGGASIPVFLHTLGNTITLPASSGNHKGAVKVYDISGRFLTDAIALNGTVNLNKSCIRSNSVVIVKVLK